MFGHKGCTLWGLLRRIEVEYHVVEDMVMDGTVLSSSGKYCATSKGKNSCISVTAPSKQDHQ